jgi:hypothetical protein
MASLLCTHTTATGVRMNSTTLSTASTKLLIGIPVITDHLTRTNVPWLIFHLVSCRSNPLLQEGDDERAQMLARALRKLGYEATITPINQIGVRTAVQV